MSLRSNIWRQVLSFPLSSARHLSIAEGNPWRRLKYQNQGQSNESKFRAGVKKATRGAHRRDTFSSAFPHHDVCFSFVCLKCFLLFVLSVEAQVDRMCESSSNCGSAAKIAPFPMAYCVRAQHGKWKRKAEDDDKSEAISWCRTYRIHCNDFRVLLLPPPTTRSHHGGDKLLRIGSIFISNLRQKINSFSEKKPKRVLSWRLTEHTTECRWVRLSFRYSKARLVN